MSAEALANFFLSLTIMWKGMLGIFIVMLVLMITIFLLSKYIK